MITTSEKEPILIDLDASREVHLKRLYNCVVGQAFSTSGKYLFIANKCGDIFVQSVDDLEDVEKNAKPMKCFEMSTNMPIKCLSYYKDYVIVGTNGLIYGLKWIEEKMELFKQPSWFIPIPLSAGDRNVPVVNSIWLRPNTDRLFIACHNSIIYEISLELKSMIRFYNGHKSSVFSVCGPDDNNYTNQCIYTASKDGSVRIWSTNEKNATIVLRPFKTKALERPRFGKWISTVSPVDEQWLVCGGGPRLSLWHLNSRTFTNVYKFPTTINVCKVIDDLVVAGGQHQNLHIYKVNGERWSSIITGNTSIYSVIASRHPYQFLAVAGFSNTLAIIENDYHFLDISIDLYS